ncbi:MAG: efflux RND transporter periplasmic adaptor subunit [Candidatus Eisenbacteria bacterium]|nr:efflux RND transporter periplasmic adaptor subunit [Candidatus Latescibacterota bacterium]MBD3302721.1 efflux RND transporter periplasmic adaptor subunit [Candidatus Eisenbacteria bacterium]
MSFCCSPRPLTRNGCLRFPEEPGSGLGAVLLALFLASLVSVSGCGSGGQAGDEDAADSATVASGEESPEGEAEEEAGEKKKEREKTTSVHAVRVARADLVVPIVAEGKIRARSSAEIRAEIGGRIDQVAVEEGSRVARGQLLVRLDGREYEVAIAEARSRYLEALSRLMIEEEDLTATGAGSEIEERLVELWNRERDGEISREERLEREREIEVEALRKGTFRRDLVEARTGLAAARADEERGRLNLERTQIRAPFAGVVQGLDADPGERVAAGEVLCTIVDDRHIEAEVGVLESDLRGLEVGRPAFLAVPALEETLQVAIDVISPTIDPESRTCSVLLRFDNEGGRIRPGMFVRASIAGRTFEDRLLAPREAILTREGRPLLFRVEDDRAKWVYVALGPGNDTTVEIARVIQGGPLEAGASVVVSNHLTLTDDAKIKVRGTREIDDPWIRLQAEE